MDWLFSGGQMFWIDPKKTIQGKWIDPKKTIHILDGLIVLWGISVLDWSRKNNPGFLDWSRKNNPGGLIQKKQSKTIHPKQSKNWIVFFGSIQNTYPPENNQSIHLGGPWRSIGRPPARRSFAPTPKYICPPP
jgi:hypothetical protein